MREYVILNFLSILNYTRNRTYVLWYMLAIKAKKNPKDIFLRIILFHYFEALVSIK